MKEVCNILVKTSFKDSDMFQPIVPGGKLNLQEKGAIVALHDREISATGITQQLGCSRNTVTKWIHRFQDTGNVNRKVGSLVARHSSITSDESHRHFFKWGKSILID